MTSESPLGRKLLVFWNDGDGGFSADSLSIAADVADAPVAFSALPKQDERTPALFAYVGAAGLKRCGLAASGTAFRPSTWRSSWRSRAVCSQPTSTATASPTWQSPIRETCISCARSSRDELAMARAMARQWQGIAAISCGLWLCCSQLQAQTSAEISQAKTSFRAGATAYELGDYLAAIQALQSAYHLSPLPAIAFSLAQAERRQYFVDRDRGHLERAIELYRDYLRQVPSAGRRSDATDALSQLESLRAAQPQGEAVAATASDVGRTRLLISCEAKGARIALDGGAALSSPAIAEVSPGAHRLQVSAPGYDPSDRVVRAVPGELLPIEITLHEQPASVQLEATPSASIYVDDALVGELSQSKQLRLPAGGHTFTFAKNGYNLVSLDAQLVPGGSRTVQAQLNPTAQRITAYALFIAGGLGVATSAVLGSFALAREGSARAVLMRKERGNISSAQLHDYNDALEERNRLRVFAALSLSLSAAALATGLFLFLFDHPELPSPLEQRGSWLRPTVQLELPTPGHERDSSFDARWRF